MSKKLDKELVELTVEKFGPEAKGWALALTRDLRDDYSLSEEEWKKIEAACQLEACYRDQVNEILRTYWRERDDDLDPTPALDAVRKARVQIEALVPTLAEIGALKLFYYEHLVFLPHRAPEQVAKTVTRINDALRRFYHELNDAERDLQRRNGRPSMGPLKKLIRQADEFWNRRTGTFIQGKGKDLKSWRFLSVVVEIAEKDTRPDTLRKYFGEHQRSRGAR